jgi:hypothetical protein
MKEGIDIIIKIIIMIMIKNYNGIGLFYVSWRD